MPALVHTCLDPSQKHYLNEWWSSFSVRSCVRLICCGLVLVNFIHIPQGYFTETVALILRSNDSTLENMGEWQLNSQGADTVTTPKVQHNEHDDVIKWKHFPRYWPFVRGIHRSSENFPHKVQRRGALMFSLICAWINVWVNNREAGDLRRHRVHYDVIVMKLHRFYWIQSALVFTPKCLWPQTTHSSPVRARYGLSVVRTNSDLCFALITVVLHSLSCYIGPCYKGTWLCCTVKTVSPVVTNYICPHIGVGWQAVTKGVIYQSANWRLTVNWYTENRYNTRTRQQPKSLCCL